MTERQNKKEKKKEKNFRYLTSCTPSSRKEGRPHKFSILGRCYYDINPRPHFYAFRTRPPAVASFRLPFLAGPRGRQDASGWSVCVQSPPTGLTPTMIV